MSDLLNKLNDKMTNKGSQSKGEGSAGAEPTVKAADVNVNTDPAPTGDKLNEAQGNLDRGADLISRANGKEVPNKEASKAKDEPATAKKEEASGTVKDPDSWDIDSAFKEIKKLREENKQYRLQRQEDVAKVKEQMQSMIAEREAELEKARQAELELAKIKEAEVDKKRSLEEKLADREAKLQDLSIKLDTFQKTYEQKLSEREEKLQEYESMVRAQEEVYKQRLEGELAKVPEKFRSHAELLVEGAKAKGGDYRDALIALNEAALQGVFEEKSVVVNHAVPGAHDGARASKEKLDEAARAQREKMTPQQKIKSALNDIRSGVPNSAYRPK